MPVCPLCGDTSTVSAFKKNEFRYHRCRRCQSLFVDLKMGDGAVHEHYSGAYYESESLAEKGRRGYPSYRTSYATLMNGFHKKLDFIRKYVSGGKLLDAGAAYGYFLKVAEPYFEGEGIDVSNFAAMIAQREFNAQVKVGDIENVDVPDGFFDVVVMWDIIEHTIRPLKSLKEVARILKPEGYLFVSTDDAANWLPKILGKHWWSLGAPMHLCHFSKQGLTIACGRAGLGPPIFFSDPREYTFPEVIKHFGVSYESNFLKTLGLTLEKSVMNKLAVHIARPEQFIAVIQKHTP
jgi:2-polyprenyl-3-methyl-5-hydroxy-6-metoxy-1,4-benzoquinol methylase